MADVNYYSVAHHETASKFVDQESFAAKYSAGGRADFLDFLWPIRFNGGGNGASCGKLMKKLIFIILLIASPAWAQMKLVPKNAAAHADPCVPIGRTADGKLVYSMKCDNLPAPPPPPQAEIKEAPPPPPPPQQETQRGGLFGWSYDKRPEQ